VVERAHCGTQNRAGRKVCADYGTPLAVVCGAEEVRELLSRHVDTCRRLVELSGGIR
jgi:hypothetical protein